jgi:hypothetical protein
MVLAFPEVYRASVQRVEGPGNNDNAWRLPPARAQELRDVASGVEESNAGVCCRYLLDSLAVDGSPDIDFDGYVHHLEAAERFVDRYGDYGKIPLVATWRARIGRTRRAIARLRLSGDHTSANVLYVAYGPPDPSSVDLIEWLGRELAPLGRYVDAVERLRLEMAKQEALASTRVDADDGPVSLGLHRARLARADRCLSSADALRAALSPFREPAVVPIAGEHLQATEARREARRERQRAYGAQRDAFFLEVKIEARRMLLSAERLFYVAWLASARP